MKIEIKPTYIIVVIGKRGSGKTFLIRYLVRECDFKDTVVYNGNLDEDYSQERDFSGCDNVKVIPRTFTSPEWDSFNDPQVSKGKFVVIDEMDMVNMHHPDFYKEWVNTGRHWPSGGIAAGRRPTMLPRDLTANADLTFIFKARESSVQRFLKDSYTNEVSEEAARLKRYEFLIVDASQDLVARAILSPDGKRMRILEEYSAEDNADIADTTHAEGSTPQNPRRKGVADGRRRAPTDAPHDE